MVHTDSVSAVHTLSRPVISDNNGLVTHVLHLTATLRGLGCSATLSWISLLVSMVTTEQMRLHGVLLHSIRFLNHLCPVSLVYPTLSYLSSCFRRTQKKHLDAVATGSFSGSWYAVHGKRPQISRSAFTLPRGVRVNLHRLQLGYTGRSVIQGCPLMPCPYWYDVAQDSLQPYPLLCPTTEPQRDNLQRHIFLDDDTDAASVLAAVPLNLLLEIVKVIHTTFLRHVLPHPYCTTHSDGLQEASISGLWGANESTHIRTHTSRPSLSP